MDDVRIICISGMVEDDKIDDLKAAGANDFLHKPFEVERWSIGCATCSTSRRRRRAQREQVKAKS